MPLHQTLSVSHQGFVLQGAEIGDQKRVMTPQEAHKIGSDYIVVGRPIIQAENPWDAYHEIKRQWNS